MCQSSYAPDCYGKCPHCGHDVCFSKPLTTYWENGKGQGFSSTLWAFGAENVKHNVYVYSSLCPNPDCHKPIVAAEISIDGKKTSRLVYPPNFLRFAPPEVPENVKQDFIEASSSLPISEKASAALSRRCLQNMLNDKGYKGKDLCDQIDLAMKDLPSSVSANLDAVRQIGNFAAHPIKFQATGEIADVEPDEAMWNLDVLEQLFDFFYVQPKIAEAKRNALNAKLQGLGKPPLKTPQTKQTP